MKSLSTAELLDYLRIAKELETSCYEQRRIQNGIKNEINRSFAHMKEWTQVSQKVQPKKPKSRVVGNIIWPILMGIFGAGLGFGFYYVLLIFLLIPSFFVDLDFIVDNPQIFAVLGLLIGVGLTVWIRVSDTRDETRKYTANLAHYHQEQTSAKTNLTVTNQRIPALKAKFAETGSYLGETQAILQRVYNCGYLYPKYRNLVAVCTILEYLESGRCETLTGSDGAYNLYENELRLNVIIGKLDDVICHLEEISANQQMLAGVIRESTRKTNSILNAMQDTLTNIERNTAYTQYYSSVTAANTSYLTWVKSFEVLGS